MNVVHDKSSDKSTSGAVIDMKEAVSESEILLKEQNTLGYQITML